MAERFRDGLFIPSLDEANTRWPKGYDKQTFVRAFSEEWAATEHALEELGVEYDTPPGEINRIDEVTRLTPFKDTEVFEVTGVPGSGKSVLSAELVRRSEGNTILLPEPYDAVRKLGHLKRRDYPDRIVASVLMTDELLEIALKLVSLDIEKEEKQRLMGQVLNSQSVADIWDLHDDVFEIEAITDKKGIVVADRLYEARVWARSLFLAGRIGFEEFVKLEEMNTVSIRGLTPSITGLKPPESVVIILATPADSLKRKGREGDLMNEEFLRVLYTQYLRRYWELSVNEFPNLVLFDATCNEEKAMEKMSKIYSQISGDSLTH